MQQKLTTYESIRNECTDTIRRSVLYTNHLLGRYKDVIWLIGDGRSGTTWVSSLINHDKKYREMFEPFHPTLVEKANFLKPHQYVKAGEENPELYQLAADIFSGKLTHARVDYGNRAPLYSGLLVKDIFANLIAHWASAHFPHVKIVLLIRNPFSVALSKYKKKGWFWATDPAMVTSQNGIMSDHLAPFEDIIGKTSSKNDYILNQVLIWSMINYVPLKQFAPGEIDIVFYEEIQSDPNNAIGKLLEKGLRQDQKKTELSEEIINQPSKVSTFETNISQGSSPITSWKNEISTKQIDEGLEILDAFGFGKLYDESSMPDRNELNTIHGRSKGE